MSMGRLTGWVLWGATQAGMLREAARGEMSWGFAWWSFGAALAAMLLPIYPFGDPDSDGYPSHARSRYAALVLVPPVLCVFL